MCPKHGQDFKPSAAHFYPNIARVPPPPPLHSQTVRSKNILGRLYPLLEYMND